MAIYKTNDPLERVGDREPVSLPPKTIVRMTVEPPPDAPTSFLCTAQSLNLEGPSDWATNFESYLDGERAEGEA